MAYSDWNHYGNANSNHALDDTPTYEGSGSLHVNDVSDSSYDILAQSETDSPTEARILTEGYSDTTYSAICTGIFRFQDTSNYYAASAFYQQTDDWTQWSVGKVVGGTITTVDRQNINSSHLGNVSLEDGANPVDRWVPYRIDAWVDSGGDFRFRLEEDSSRDGSWSQLGTDIVDTTPDLTGGGGTGVGSPGEIWDYWNGESYHYDATEVYY